MVQLLGAILRGLRARALLSSGSVLLTALAIGSAVLGPVFATAVTNSYVVTRLDEAPASLTGLSRVFTPGSAMGTAEASEDAVSATDALNEGPWGTTTATVESERFMALRGAVQFWARDGACDLLDVTGRCPEKPGEVLMLAKAAEQAGATVGERLALVGFEPGGLKGLGLPRPPLRTVTVVGTYTTPTSDDQWLVPGRLTVTNEAVSDKPGGGYTPYSPGPVITTPETIEQLGDWTVRVDTLLDVPPDVTPDDLAVAASSAAAIPEDTSLEVEGGTLVDDGTNDLASVVQEVEDQQATARSSIAPAVLSLVLVALALLMRLLNAASELRVPELALASLRGVTSRRLWGLGLAEPVALLVLATPIGVGLGIGFSLLLVRQWLVPGLPLPLPASSWVAASLVLVAAFAVACVAVGLVVRESLASQLAGVRRPVAARRWSVVAQLTLVALAAAILVSKLSDSGQGDPDVTDLLLPVLLAVVAGLGATRLTAALATWWTRRSRGRSLSGFVSSRAISRRQEGTLVILPITAAIAVAVFGAGVYSSAADWRTSVAATISPADTTWHSPVSFAETLELTRRIDPEGQWVMAAGSVLNPGAHFSVVDSSRLATVATWPPTWSPGLDVEEVVDEIRPPGTVPTFDGRRISVTVDNQVESDRPLALEVRFGRRDGIPLKVYLGPYARGESTSSAKVPWCGEVPCPIEGMTLGGGAGTNTAMSGTATITAIDADGEPVDGALAGADWVPTPDPAVRSAITGLDVTDAGIDLDLDTGDSVGMARLTAGGIVERRPALEGPKVQQTALAKLDEGFGLIRVDPVGEIEGMPFVGPSGLLVDYSSFITDRPVYNSNLDTRVLQRAGAPADVTEALSAAGLSVESTLAGERHVLDQTAYALALRLYGVVAALVLVMALAGLFVSAAVQLPARRRDAAALRVVGVPRSSVMVAVVRELAVVLGSAAIAGILAGSLAQYVVLRTITLGYAEGLATPALVATISPVRLVVLALLAAAVFGAVALVSASMTVRGARGSTLRESAR
ncbi:FtsX-like permease family protein [Nocardioides oleivorans]|uniref:FtsX-like permease family protein n=1 Tax=Nocardioides oleivorans TaxID=273676 RepID=A0A4Q2S0V6_9ACTN|nr:FtsX-like permease family protein [Nocardioides oleivorans]RYB93944.1 FtsX-like permease family protein [Nocardioides oleivorans]